jgi:hypothetical protein
MVMRVLGSAFYALGICLDGDAGCAEKVINLLEGLLSHELENDLIASALWRRAVDQVDHCPNFSQRARESA